jgi:hypothetical protein
LHDWIPVFSFLRAPARFGVLVVLAVSALAAIGVAWLTRERRRAGLLAAAFTIGALAELTSIPLWFEQAPPFPTAYRKLATLPRAPVAEFPFFWRRAEFPRHALYMLNSTVHFQPLVNGYSDHIPHEFREMVEQVSGFPQHHSFAVLERLGVRYVIFHLDLYGSESQVILLQWLDDFKDYLRPLWREKNVWLYEIVAFPS